MQTALIEGTGPGSPREDAPAIPAGGLRMLLALVSRRGPESEELRTQLGLEPEAYGRILADLQRTYLVDVVSSLEGERVRESLRLTELGESTLSAAMEKICELPE